MTEKPPSPGDIFVELFGWDVRLENYEQRLRSIRADVLVNPTRAFLFNLRNVDNLLLSPFLIAADGVQQFYWTLKYVATLNRRIVSVLKGETDRDMLHVDPALRILEADSSLRAFLSTPDGLEEFAGQIDARLRHLTQLKDFMSATRVQLLSAVVLIWTAYESLRNELAPINKRYGLASPEFHISNVNMVQLTNLKEYRNLIVHRAAIVDDRFVLKVGRQCTGEHLVLDANVVSGFFNCVAEIGTSRLTMLDLHVGQSPLTH